MAEEQNRNVRDVMTANPKTVTEKDSVLDVARIMRDQDTGVVPVVDGKKIIGMVTDRDIVVRAIADGKDIKNVRVNDVMSKQVRTVSEDASVHEVFDVMSGAQIRRVPVVNRNNEIVGIVSMKDLATETKETNKVGKAVEEISEGPANN
ncbi:MAG TPA: CBS domain-containing protein [Thermoanaerobaculia bacterium]|nr:CBS domain-containing protein [Thermoanaerobaculia bacterium]